MWRDAADFALDHETEKHIREQMEWIAREPRAYLSRWATSPSRTCLFSPSVIASSASASSAAVASSARDKDNSAAASAVPTADPTGRSAPRDKDLAGAGDPRANSEVDPARVAAVAEAGDATGGHRSSLPSTQPPGNCGSALGHFTTSSHHAAVNGAEQAGRRRAAAARHAVGARLGRAAGHR